MSPGPEQDSVWTVVAAFAVIGIGVLAVAVVVGIVAPGAAGPFAHGSDGGPANGQDQGADTSHVDPDTVGGGTSLGGLERQLGSSLVQQARQGALNLSREDVDQVRDRLGDDRYEELLEEYRDVAGETGSDERYETVFQARRAQFNFTQHVADYWERFQRYETVTSLDEDERPSLGNSSGRIRFDHPYWSTYSPRDIARRLETRTARMNESLTMATEAYHDLSEMRDEDFTEVVQSLNESRQSVLRVQREVRAEQFLRTNLTLTVDPGTVAPDKPTTIAGRLTATNGTSIDRDAVTFEIGEQNTTTNLTADGEFSFDYRPTLLSMNASELTVRFRPANDSIYLGDARTLDVAVDRARPNVTVSANETTARFNQTVAITGRLRSGEAGHADVPYLLTVGGRVVDRNVTGPAGTIDRTVRVPASALSGEREIEVSVPLEDRALEPATGATTIEVRETESELVLNASQESGRTVAVDGRLRGIEGGGVPNQSIQFDIGGEAVGTTQTDRTGRFATHLALPRSGLDDGGSVTVRATFEGAGTNLDAATAGQAVTVPSSSSGGVVPAWPLVVVVLGAFGLGGGFLIYRHRPWRRSPRRGSTEDVPDPMDVSETEADVVVSLLDRGAELLAEDRPAAAVRTAYAALRYRLAGETEATRTQTHWEFYRTYRDRLDDEAATTLRRATECYERATFAGESVDTDTAGDVLSAARDLAEPRSNAVSSD